MNILFGKGRGTKLLQRRIEAINSHVSSLSYSQFLELDDFAGFSGQITRRSIFNVLKTKGIQESIARRILANDSPAYIPSGVGPDDALPVLQKYPFIKILAHPAAGSFPGKSHYKEVNPPFEIVKKIARELHFKLEFDGMEIYYPAHTAQLRDEIRSFGRELHLTLWTGGSDCHDFQSRPPAVDGMPYEEWAIFKETLNRLSTR